MYITIQDLAAEVNCNFGTLRQVAKDFPECLYKKELKLLNKKGVEYSRYIWVIDKENIPLFKKLWAMRHKSFVSDGWTTTARECYEAKLTCHRCVNYKVCQRAMRSCPSRKPPIKDKVIELYTKYGKPRKELINDTNRSI